MNQYQKEDKGTVLRFGMFAGSNWDVPNFRLYSSAMSMADMEIGRMLRGETSMDTGLLKLQREINGLLKQ